MTSASPSSEPSIEEGSPRRHPSANHEAPSASRARTIPHADSEDSLRQQSERTYRPIAASSQSSNSDVTVSPRDRNMQPDYNQDTSSGHDHHRAYAVSEATKHPSEQQRNHHHPSISHPHSHSRSRSKDHVVTKRIILKSGKEDHSPPLTGKDSAYSSVSGGSKASPIAIPLRSASAQSSHPRAQFGLFPSNNPGTPKHSHSLSSRHGAMSPSPVLSSQAEIQEPVYNPAPRSQSSFDNYSSSPRRLLKKSSLSSLKRLFSKKKHGAVDRIVE